MSLRDKKCANLKKKIIDAMLSKITNIDFDHVSIKEICMELEISEGTFYNYFPKKTDILLNFIEFWAIDAFYHAKIVEKTQGSIAAINEIFDFTGLGIIRQPVIMYEIIAYIAKQKNKLCFGKLSPGDIKHSFDKICLDSIDFHGFNDIIIPFLENAKKQKLIKPDLCLDNILLQLKTVFFGTPIAVGQENAHLVGDLYKKNLSIIWNFYGIKTEINSSAK